MGLCLFSEFGPSKWIFSSKKWYTHTHTHKFIQTVFLWVQMCCMAMKTIWMGLKSSTLEKQWFWRKSVRQDQNTALIKEFLIFVFIILVFQKMTRWKNCRNSRGKNCAKYAWTKILALSSSHVGTWLLVKSVQNHSSSVQSAVEA